MGRVWFFFKNFYLFPCGCAVFHCREGFSLAAVSGGYSLVAMLRLLIAVASLIPEHRLYGA